MSSREGWIRPAGVQEQFGVELYQHNCLIISYVLRVASSRQITEQDARKVFTSLYRKTPNLRVVFQERDGEHWLRVMQEEKLDFQVVPNADANKVFHEMARYTFDDNGPLWAVRFLPWSPEVQTDFVNLTKMEPSEDQPKKLPFMCHFVIAYHHGIADGHTCLGIMKHVLRMFDDLLAGKTIDDTEQIAVLIDSSHEQAIYDELETTFQKDPELLAARKESYESCTVETLLEKVFPVKPKVKPANVCIPYILDRNTTKKFTARCKKEGVTFHTGFSSVLEAAIVQILLEAKIDNGKDSFEIPSIHTINHRSLYKNCANAFGCGMGAMDVKYENPKNILEDFWVNARKFHSKFKDQQQRKTSFEHHVIEKMTGVCPLSHLDNDGVEVPLPKLLYYATSNMQDVSKAVGNIGDHIQLEYYDRLTSVHKLGFLWISIFQTLNGQLMHSLQYSVHLLGAEAAQVVSDTIFKILRSVV